MPVVTIPITAWLVCGLAKFATNFIRYGYDAVQRIGLGGFPSNHTAVVSSIMWALALTGDWHTAGLALGVLMIHVFDATSLRREVGRLALALNPLVGSQLREFIGHNLWEIAGGLTVGLAVACTYWSIGAIP